MNTFTKRTGFALTLAAALAAVPAGISAQECAAQVSPSVIPAGEAAVSVTVRFTEPVGAVAGFEGGESGIATASTADLPRTEMAADEQPEPIQMGEEQNVWTVWLNTADAEPGTYTVGFVGDAGNCAAELSVSPNG